MFTTPIHHPLEWIAIGDHPLGLGNWKIGTAAPRKEGARTSRSADDKFTRGFAITNFLTARRVGPTKGSP